jgi:hypothetical protein
MAKQKKARSRIEKRQARAPNRSSSEPGHAGNGSAPSATLTVRVPLTLSRRGGRKVILTPSGRSAWAPRQTRVDNSLVKAIARAHRWKRMMESGAYASVTDLAAAERINQSFICRVLRLTLLAPIIVEAIMDGRHRADMTLATLMRPFPAGWREQVGRIPVALRPHGSGRFAPLYRAMFTGPTTAVVAK